MKWEQIFVAYSDCGKYKIEIKDVSPCGQGDEWDWNIYQDGAGANIWTDVVYSALEYVESFDDAKMFARRELEWLQAEDKRREEESQNRTPEEAHRLMCKHIADLDNVFAAISGMNPIARGDFWAPPAEVRDECKCCSPFAHFPGCPKLRAQLEAETRTGTTTDLLECLRTGDFSTFDQYGAHKCCGATSVEHMPDCPAVHSAAIAQAKPSIAGKMSVLEGLREHGMWPRVDPVCEDPEWRKDPELESGYNQILSLIKAQAKDVVL